MSPKVRIEIDAQLRAIYQKSALTPFEMKMVLGNIATGFGTFAALFVYALTMRWIIARSNLSKLSKRLPGCLSWILALALWMVPVCAITLKKVSVLSIDNYYRLSRESVL